MTIFRKILKKVFYCRNRVTAVTAKNNNLYRESIYIPQNVDILFPFYVMCKTAVTRLHPLGNGFIKPKIALPPDGYGVLRGLLVDNLFMQW